MAFWLFISVIIIQRILELILAKRNEKWMKSQGAIEFGQKHYPVIVFVHILFFISLIAEVHYFHKGISPLWPLLFIAFLAVQAVRIWAISSLGTYWNTKILVLPGASVIKKGPYKFLKHPNYCVVALELIIIPFMFNAYFTAILFTLLNIFVLSIRIPAEEKALKKCMHAQSTK
jgi:methyltransferase